MTITVHDDLVDFVLQLLRLPVPVTTQGPVGEDVEFEMLGEADLEGVRVELVNSNPTDQFTFNGPIDWSTQLAITCGSRGDARTPAGRASRQLHNLVHKRLRVDPSLGDRVHYMGPPQLAFESGSRDTKYGVTAAVYELRHRSASQNLEKP